MQVNQPKGGTVEATTSPMAVDDEVSYVEMIARGRECILCARTGVITEIDGIVATLQAADGRKITRPLDKLTPAGQPNVLTRMLMGGQ